MVEILIFWLALAFIAGLIASGKGRFFFGFFLLSIILSPLIGIIGALIAKGDTVKIEKDLSQYNVEIIYFSYTLHTSSTMLRNILKKVKRPQ
ncbi:MAG: hypothetical protein P8L91_01240 [Candidatus Marinimicrobia bacterium]|nr:hypothetical protein [Candidatus Neomarinimicrobiota bacterium]